MRVRGLLAVALVAALAGCKPAPPRHPTGDTNPQGQLARTMSIIRHATPDKPNTLKILFYGQSITPTKWTDPAVAHLRATYPNTHFIVRNMAIGGFAAQLLERTVERDVTEFYPDLIVFHVYGDHHAYERIIRTLRSKTAAEVIVQTDHLTTPIEPLCDEGFHLVLKAPPGCKGFLRYKQNSWEEFMAGQWEPTIAARYGLAIDPRRWAWNAYLQRHHLKIEQLLADPPHPNAAGWALMARLFETWFDWVVRSGGDHPQSLVEDHPVAAETGFTGNRVELIARTPLDGRIGVQIDGKRPDDIDGCWQIGRTTMVGIDPKWPAIRQVSVDPADHRPEQWTAVLTDMSPNRDDFRFKLYSSVTGFDGEGSGKADFTSRSGKVRIAAKDWVMADLFRFHHVSLPDGFKVEWDRHFVCGDEAATDLGNGRREIRHVAGTGLANGPHRMSIQFAPGAFAEVSSIRSYRPPLAD